MRRPVGCLWTAAIFAWLLLLAALPERADAAPRAAAMVTAIAHDVQVQRNGGPFLPLQFHGLLYPGDVVRSGPNGEAELLFLRDGASVKVYARSSLRITAGLPARRRDSLFQATFGLIWAHVRPGTDVESPHQTNAVTRGTEILLAVSDDGVTTLTVIEGEVTFSNPLGVRELTTSQRSISRPDQAPTPPVAVDPSGLIAWTADVTALPLEFELPGLTPRPAGPPDFTADAARAETAVQAAPGDAAAWVSLGQARRGLGDLPDALDAFTRAERLDGNNVDAAVGTALTYLSQGRAELARAALEPVRGRPVALAVRGLADLHEGRGREAEQDLRAALQGDPHLYVASALLALAELGRHDLPDADAASRQAVAEQSDSAQTQGTRAMVLFFAGQPEAAQGAARRAAQINPLSPFALLTEGRVLLARQQTDAARTACEKAASMAPYLPLVHQELGAVYQRLDMPRKAAEEYGIALKLAPNSSDAHTGLGLALQSQGRYAAAESEHRQALTLDPNNATAHYNLATLYIDRGRLDEARRELDSGVQSAPDRGILYARLAEVSLYRQDLFAAQEFARRAVSLLPDSALAHYELGRVYLEQERTIQAEQEFRQATTLDRQFAAARYALGLAEDEAATGRDPSQPLGTIAAVSQSGASSALNIQQLDSVGAQERIQAAIQDPTVVRVASRSFGDAQFDGRYGDKGVRGYDFSYLHESNDRQTEAGLTTQSLHDDGVRPNSSTTDERDSALFGYKAQDNPFGLFVEGDYQRQDLGWDVGLESTLLGASQRIVNTIPNLLIGLNLHHGEDQSTRFLFQTDQPIQHITDMSEATHTDGRSFDGELRHDASLSRNDTLSVGIGAGYRAFRANSNFFPIPDPDPTLSFAGLNLLVDTNVRTFRAYVRDTWTIGTDLTLTGEMRVERVDSHVSNETLAPDGTPSTPPTTLDTTVGLPALIVAYLPDVRDGLRLRIRKLLGTIQDFDLLSPTDVFLFSFDNVPDLQLGGRGESYELEYDHTFRDASFLRLGAFQQDLRNAVNANADTFPRVRFRSAQIRYEGILNPATTFFLDGSVNDVRGPVDFSSLELGLGPSEPLDLIPAYQAQVGFQFLDRSGWFAQPSFAYQGPRYEPANFPGDVRSQAGGFGLFNARIGKRWGLRSTAFVEVVNAFNQRYTVLGGGNEQLEPGRELRIGASVRF